MFLELYSNGTILDIYREVRRECHVWKIVRMQISDWVWVGDLAMGLSGFRKTM
jgi:hypothetical protein